MLDKMTSFMRCSRDRQRGASLLKILIILMVIVLAIAFIGGCLAAIGGPVTNDYQQRARLVEGIRASENVRAALRTYFDTHGRWPLSSAGAIHSQLRLPTPEELSSGNVRSMTVEEHGRIRLEYDDEARNAVLLLTPSAASGKVEWRCTSPNRVKPTELPQGCR